MRFESAEITKPIYIDFEAEAHLAYHDRFS